jgi:putative transposase
VRRALQRADGKLRSWNPRPLRPGARRPPAAADAQPSVGTAGDTYDNALAESVIGLYKTELIKLRGPWRTAEQAELATLDYVDWYNHQRLFETCGDIPPAELETVYYGQNTSLAGAG